MDGLQGFRFRVSHQFPLKPLNVLTEMLQDEEVVVHDGVSQCVGQVVGPHLPHPALASSDPLSHGVEGIALPLLEGDHEVGTEDEAHLFVLYLSGLFGIAQHAEHDKDVAVIILKLRALPGTHDVLHHQRMEPVVAAQGFHNIRPVKAVDVDPSHRRKVLEGEAILNLTHLPFFEVLLIIVDQRHPDLPCLLLPHMYEGPRRQADLLRCPLC